MPPAQPMQRRYLLSAGISRHTLDGDLRARRTVAPYRGVHVASDLIDARGRIHAAVATQNADATVGFESGAVLLTLPWTPDEWSAAGQEVDLYVPESCRGRNRPGLRLHRDALPDRHITIAGGLRCASTARTLIDLSRSGLDRTLAVTLVDGCLRFNRCSRNDLLAVLASMPGRRGVREARTVVLLARDGVDSPPETCLRLILHDAGFLTVEPGYSIRDDASGDTLARADLADDALLLWGEYDGFLSHSGRETFRGDRVGDRWLERRGWHVLRFVDDDLRRPARVRAEWAAARAQAPARIMAMSPTRSPEVARAQARLRDLR